MLKNQIAAKLSMFFISLVLILSIFAFMLLNGSAAWLSGNKESDAEGMRVSVAKDIGAKVTVESYPVTLIEGNLYTIPDRETESYTIPMHDPSSISYSKYKKALVIIVKVTAHADSTINIELHRDETTEVDTIINPSLSNYISNCIKITPADIEKDGTVATKSTSAASQTFVNLSADPIEKRTDITLVESEDVAAGVETEFCFIMEYDLDLLGYIEQRILEQHYNNNEITYFDDIEFCISG